MKVNLVRILLLHLSLLQVGVNLTKVLNVNRNGGHRLNDNGKVNILYHINLFRAMCAKLEMKPIRWNSEFEALATTMVAHQDYKFCTVDESNKLEFLMNHVACMPPNDACLSLAVTQWFDSDDCSHFMERDTRAIGCSWMLAFNQSSLIFCILNASEDNKRDRRPFITRDKDCLQCDKWRKPFDYESVCNDQDGKKAECKLIGPRGYTGRKGDVGILGDKGDSIQGQTGRKGTKGFKGETGKVGVIGVAGIKGTKGEKGIKGLAGDYNLATKGTRGNQGAKGTKGVRGISGDKGASGEPLHLRTIEIYKNKIFIVWNVLLIILMLITMSMIFFIK